MISNNIISVLKVKPDSKVKLSEIDTGIGFSEELREFSKSDLKNHAKEVLDKNLKELADMQELLYASDSYALLIIFQGMDAAGKDGIIKHVMSGVNPQGCQVYSFKQPSMEELDHDFLWRCVNRLPERGRIGIFNRSYYEEVIVVRVHPDILEKQKLPATLHDKSFWQQRYDDINSFENHLFHNGTIVLKFFLHISKKEQKERFLERLENPQKYWKFSAADIAERGSWDDYMKAYGEALGATSTEWAPWYIIPSDHKWVARAIVADILVSRIKSLNLRYPGLTPEQMQALAEAKKRLEKE